MRPPVHLQQTVNSGHAVIDNPRHEDSESIQSETHLAARHHAVDAVVQQSHHVYERHEESAPADDSGTVVDEVEELDVVRLVAHLRIVHILGHIGNDKHAQVVHLRGNAKWVN